MNEKIKPLMQLAHDSGRLNGKFEKAVRAHIDQTYHLADQEFWPILEELRDAMIKATGATMAPKYPDSKKVIEEFVRARLFDAKHKVSCNEREEKREFWAEQTLATWEKLASFTRTYGHMKKLVYKVCDKFTDLDMGDDGFGDFCDSFVLVGKTKFGLLMDGSLATMKQIHANMFQHPLERFIMRGENYIEMMLSEALIEKAPSVARDFFVDHRDEPLESVEKDLTSGVGRDMDLEAIVAALAPVLEKTTRPIPGLVQVNLTTTEHAALTKVIQMLQLADLVNYKKAQDSFPRLLQAVKLVVAIADNPEANPTEKISLSPKTRAQLDRAISFTEK
jgi:hypothetical protein